MPCEERLYIPHEESNKIPRAVKLFNPREECSRILRAEISSIPLFRGGYKLASRTVIGSKRKSCGLKGLNMSHGESMRVRASHCKSKQFKESQGLVILVSKKSLPMNFTENASMSYLL